MIEIERDEPEFTDEELRDIREFFKTAAGQKLIETLDTKAANKNNLLKAVNLVSDVTDSAKVGSRCSLLAVEVRAYMDVVEFLTTVGTDDAD